MAVPDIEYVKIPVLHEYGVAKKAYDLARGRVVDAFRSQAQLWYNAGWTEAEVMAQLRLAQVPEDLLPDILGAALQAAEQVRTEAAEDLRQLLALEQDPFDDVTVARVRAALRRMEGEQ